MGDSKCIFYQSYKIEILSSLRFADGQAIIAQDGEHLSYMIKKLDDLYKEWKLKVNVKKTEYVIIGNKEISDLLIEVSAV